MLVLNECQDCGGELQPHCVLGIAENLDPSSNTLEIWCKEP